MMFAERRQEVICLSETLRQARGGRRSVTHEDAGKYAAKHAAGTTPDPAIAAALERRAEEGTVACVAAHEIAGDLGVAPSEVGKTVDLLEYRIVGCQLGLFGYSPQRKIVEPADAVSEELRHELGRAAPDGRISCASVWAIADAQGLPRMSVAAACETLSVKIKNCQLGAF
jgi:hypothetical protein